MRPVYRLGFHGAILETATGGYYDAGGRYVVDPWRWCTMFRKAVFAELRAERRLWVLLVFAENTDRR
jgi:hypothetical protein